MNTANHFISIRQPWASAIVDPEANKDIENREWPTRFRGTVFIHASKTHYEQEFIKFCSGVEDRDMVSEAFLDSAICRKLPLGYIVGQADIVDCVEEHDSKWFCGRFGFVLENRIKFKKPMMFRGRLGICQVNAMVKCDGQHPLPIACRDIDCWHGNDNLLRGYYKALANNKQEVTDG